MIGCFLSNISAKYYEHPTMLSRVIAKNFRDVFETQCMYGIRSQRTPFLCRHLVSLAAT